MSFDRLVTACFQIQNQRIFISGQIGLLPRNLELPSPQSLTQETAMACQHVSRVIEALKNNSGGGWEGHIQLALYWVQNWQDLPHVKTAVGVLVRFHFVWKCMESHS